VPFDVFELARVGPVTVFQQTPLAVTLPPPSAVILPPETALVKVVEVIEAVRSVGTVTGLVLKGISLP
jgi:hypothetical protein